MKLKVLFLISSLVAPHALFTMGVARSTVSRPPSHSISHPITSTVFTKSADHPQTRPAMNASTNDLRQNRQSAVCQNTPQDVNYRAAGKFIDAVEKGCSVQTVQSLLGQSGITTNTRDVMGTTPLIAAPKWAI